jgi:ATP-dependent DNA ligase
VRLYSRNGLVLEWTADDKLRQPFFFGLRHDTSPRECRWDERER